MQAVGLVPKGVQDVIQLGAEIVDVLWNDIRQSAVLGLIPNVLHGIEVRRVRRKPFDLQPGGAVLQELPRGGAMSRQAIPHQNDGPAQMPMDFAHESNEILGPGVVVEQFVVQPQPQRPRGAGDGGERRKAIASIPHPLQGRLARRGPHPPPQRLQQKPTFIEKNQASLTFEALFLAAASRRGANGQSPSRRVLELAALASAHSSPFDAAACRRNRDGIPRQISAESNRELAGRSNPTARNPSAAYRASKRPATAVAAAAAISVRDQDEAWAAAFSRRRAARLASSGLPTTDWTPPTQPLPPAISPARKAGLQYIGELPALREFLKVSYSIIRRSPVWFH